MFVDGVIHAEFFSGHSGGQYSWATLISRTNDDRGAVKVERGVPPPLPPVGSDGRRPWPQIGTFV